MLQIDARGTCINLAGPIFLTRTIFSKTNRSGRSNFSDSFDPGPNLPLDYNFRDSLFVSHSTEIRDDIHIVIQGMRQSLLGLHVHVDVMYNTDAPCFHHIVATMLILCWRREVHLEWLTPESCSQETFAQCLKKFLHLCICAEKHHFS